MDGLGGLLRVVVAVDGEAIVGRAGGVGLLGFEPVVGVVDVVDFEGRVEGAVEGAVVEEGGDGGVGGGLDSVFAATIADQVVFVALDEVEGVAVARGVVDFGNEAAEGGVLPLSFAWLESVKSQALTPGPGSSDPGSLPSPSGSSISSRTWA
jgi:hypothetical protein